MTLEVKRSTQFHINELVLVTKGGNIDISKIYIDQANNRINNITDKEIDDFNKELSLHFVTKTYKDRKKEKELKKL
jgi:hypothetical protein